jgi:RNA polymerase sigma-70 factor (ECF subfamily)
LRQALARSVGRVCPPWLAAQKDDIVQIALMRVLNAQRKSELSDPVPASYLWKVAYSATVDQIRRVRRRREMELDEARQTNPDPPAPTSPDRELARKELGQAILGCLGRLQERRRLVVGFFLNGDSVKEMMRLLDWDERRVRNLLFRGLTDLRRCLTSKGIHP